MFTAVTLLPPAVCSIAFILSFFRECASVDVDRIPQVISAVLQVTQEVDEPWPLEVYDHDGFAHNITLQAGEMLLYESHTVLHGRPFPLNGSYYVCAYLPPTNLTIVITHSQ